MNTQDGTLSFDAWINNTDFKRQIDEMTQRISGLGGAAQKTGAGMDATFSKVGAALGTYFSAQMLWKFGMAVKDVRGEFEQMGVAFEVMLGSKEKADKLMGEIVTLAAKTPFTLSEVGGVTKQLLAFGEDSSTVVDTVRRLGDVAAGTGTEVKGLGLAYGQVMTKGKLQTQEMYQMAERGVPIVGELASMFGVSSKEIMKMVESGSVGFKDVQQAIINMTSEGGRFNNMMEKQSKTVTGLWSNMTDAWDEMLNSMGESNEGIIKGAIVGVTDMIKNYGALIDILKVAIAAFGTYKAAVMLTAAVEKTATLVKLEMALAEKGITFWEGLHAVMLKKLTVAQALFNKTMLANPYVLAATAIATLITLLIVYANRVSAAEQAEQEFSDRQKELADKAQEHKDAVEGLINTVNDETKAEIDRVVALGKLKEMYPQLFAQYDTENLKLADLIKLKKQIAEIDAGVLIETNKTDLEKAKARISFLEKAMEQTSTLGGELTFWKSTGMTRNNVESELAAAREALKKFQGQVQEDRNNIVYAGLKQFTDAQLQAELANHQKLLEAMKKEGAPTTADVQQGAFTGTFDQDEIKKQTEALQNELDKRNVAQFTYNELLKKYEAERVAAEKERQKIQSNPDKLPEKDLLEQLAKVDAQIKAIKEKEEALRGAKPKVEKVDTDADMKAFDNAIKFKKSEYELYYQWVTEMGKESADQEFSALLTKGATFAAYIQSEIDRLKAKTNLTPAEKEQLKKLEQDIQPDAVDYTKSADLTTYTQKVNEQAESYDKLTDKIEYLKGELLTIDNTSNTGLQKRLAVMGMLHAAQKQYAQEEKQRYKQLKEDYMTVQQQIIKSTEQTNKDVAELNKNGDTAQAGERQRQGNEQIKTLQQTLLDQMGLLDVYAGTGTDFIIKKIKDVFPTFTDFSTLTRKQLGIVRDMVDGIEITPDQFAELEAAGIDTEKLKLMLAELKKQLEKDIDLSSWEKLRDIIGGISSGMKSLGSTLSQVDGTLGDVGSAMDSLGGAMEGVMQMVDKEATTGDKISGAFAGVSAMLDMILSQIEDNKNEMNEWEQAAANTAMEMAKLRIEMLDYQRANLFGIENPFQAAVDGAEQYKQAILELLGMVEELENAQIQTGVDKKINWTNVVEGVAAGAVVGASVGSWIGAIVGAVVGGVVGLFMQDVVPVFETLKEEFGNVYDPETFAINPEILANYDKLSDEAKRIVDNWEEIQKKAEEARKQMEDTFAAFTGTLGSDLRDTLVEAFRNGDLYSAIDTFHTKVTGVLEDIISQMIFSTYFAQMFTDLQNAMMASFEGDNPDFTIVDDLLDFMAGYEEALPAFNQAMQDAQAALAEYGFDIFNPLGGAQDQLSAAIKGVTEETANLIAGQMNAIRINQAQSLVIVREQLLVLTSINGYTSYILKIYDYLTSQKQGSSLSGTGIKV
ncbi:MAG: tape measure protein [Parcubacteria group bacterium]|jgi:tape measure domain-containing protein